MKRKICISILFFGVIVNHYSCHLTNSYVNSPQDIKQGELFLHAFYENVKNINYDSIDHMMSDTLKAKVGAHGLSNMVKKINGQVGSYTGYDITSSNSYRRQGTENFISYKFLQKVHYEKGDVDEVLIFEQDKGSNPSVMLYNISFDQLLK